MSDSVFENHTDKDSKDDSVEEEEFSDCEENLTDSDSPGIVLPNGDFVKEMTFSIK